MVKRNNKFKTYQPGEYSYNPRKDAGEPVKGENSAESGFLQKIAFKDLAYAKPISVVANPTAEATRSAVPYAIINSTNQVWEAEYPGESNLAGNTMPILQNSGNSQLLQCFDAGNLDLRVNYLYAAIQPTDINQALNVQFGKSMSEALSKAYSETYMQMPFFIDTITSSMINCDPKNRTQAFFWYQTMLQNIACIPAKYNMCVSLENHLKDMCYNRNVSPIDDLMGLMRKNSFRAKINAFSNIITGEYFDLSWFKQMNTLTMVPSRKSNDMRDPLLVIDATHIVPDLTITHSGSSTPYLNSSNYDITAGGQTYTFEAAVHECLNYLSPYNILKWARQYTEGLVSTTPTQYFNQLVAWVEVIRDTLSRFPSDVADIRTVLDVANRAGLNRWQRGISFDVTREMNYQPVFNKLCNDVFVNYLASPNEIIYDNDTLRWKYYALWNEYTGLPKYDRLNGGSFLTFSTRKFPSSVTPSTDTKYLVPKLFDIPAAGYSTVEFVNRTGLTSPVGYTVYSSANILSSSIYSRLNPLGLADYTQRIPTADATNYSSIPDTGSALAMLMDRLFYLGNIKVGSSDINETVNNEVVCAVDIELDDVSNSMIAFAQAYAPFKVYTPTKERTVGFREIPTFNA